jgi:hypothetical protein
MKKIFNTETGAPIEITTPIFNKLQEADLITYNGVEWEYADCPAFREMARIKKISYKVWMTVEQHVEFEATEQFENIETDTRSAGRFDTYDEAVNQINEIGEQFEGDFCK